VIAFYTLVAGVVLGYVIGYCFGLDSRRS